MTVLGALLLLAVGVAIAVRRSWIPIIIGACAGLPYSVAVSAAGNGIPLFYAAGLVAAVLFLRTSPLRTRHWTANLLVLLAVWAVLISLLAPWMFGGIRVLSARGGLDGQILAPDRLVYTISTFAQIAYLLIAVVTVVFLVRNGGARTAVRTAFVVGTVLSAVRGLAQRVGVGDFAWLFDTNPNVPYSRLGAGERLRGVFNEPSELAAFSVPAAVFFAVMASRVTGRRRLGWVVLCGLACTNLLQAASGTAVAASAVVIAAGLVALAVRYVLRGGAGTPWLVLGALALGIVLLAGGDAVWAPIESIVSDKVGSQSWNARTGGDAFSWGVAADTLWLGTGLGGNRPSSFAMSVLSCLGVPGLALMGALLIGAVVVACRTGRLPFGLAMLGLLVAKVVGTPDMSTPVLWLLLAACVAGGWRSAVIPSRQETGVSGLEARLGPVVSLR